MWNFGFIEQKPYFCYNKRIANTNPQDRQAEFERIAARRKAMLDAEDELRKRKADEKQAFARRGQEAFRQEVDAARERAEGREEWRQGQHEKRAEEKRQKQLAEEAVRQEQIKKEQKEQELAGQRAMMDQLHERAVRQRREERKESIEKEVTDQRKRADDLSERQGREADERLQRALAAIARDTRRKEDQARADIERRRKALEGSFEHAKQTLQHAERTATVPRVKLEAGHQLMQLQSEHRHQLLRLDKELEAVTLKAKQEREALEREAREAAAKDHAKIRTEHDRRVRESLQRGQTALEAIGFEGPDGEK